MLKGLLILIRERFHPGSYIPMILGFTFANGLYLFSQGVSSVYLPLFGVAFVLMLSFFFRMRLFDEIKDYEVDLKINPTRPLARGVLSVSQVKRALLVLITFELTAAALFGWNIFAVYLATVLYSLLMYKEFFIGKWLRPHLTTYAVLHTAVSSLLGLCVALITAKISITELGPTHLAFFLMNWAYFNLFEFARKTYAAEEERPGVDTYSSLFKPLGAVALSLSQVALGLVILKKTAMGVDLNLTHLLAGLYFLMAIPYVIKPIKTTAKAFRNLTGLYLLLHYASLIFAFWM